VCSDPTAPAVPSLIHRASWCHVPDPRLLPPQVPEGLRHHLTAEDTDLESDDEVSPEEEGEEEVTSVPDLS